MNISRFNYISNSGNKFIKVLCSECGKEGISLTADCHGDDISLCEEHWKEYINEILNTDDSSQYIETGEISNGIKIYKIIPRVL